MRAKLLVAAVALTNLLLGVSLGWGLGSASDQTQAQLAPSASLGEELGDSPEPGESPAGSRASVGQPASGSRSRRRRRGGGSSRDPERMIRHLQAQVGLDEAQVAAAREVLADSHKQVKALLEHVRPRMEEIHSETQAKLRALMTPAQQEKLDALREEMERRGPPWRWEKGGRGPDGRGPDGRGPDGRGPDGRDEHDERGRDGRVGPDGRDGRGRGRRGFGPGGPAPREGASPSPDDDDDDDAPKKHQEVPTPNAGEEGPR